MKKKKKKDSNIKNNQQEKNRLKHVQLCVNMFGSAWRSLCVSLSKIELSQFIFKPWRTVHVWFCVLGQMYMCGDNSADRNAVAAVQCYERGQWQQDFLISPISKGDQPPQLI